MDIQQVSAVLIQISYNKFKTIYDLWFYKSRYPIGIKLTKNYESCDLCTNVLYFSITVTTFGKKTYTSTIIKLY